MSNATIEQLNERYEQVTTEAKAALEKLNTAVRGAYTRLEENGNELFQTLVKTGEKRQKAVAKPEKKTTAKKQPSQLDEVRGKVASALGLPTRDEVATLTRKVNKLAKEAK